jgi:hypothetical protein
MRSLVPVLGSLALITASTGAVFGEDATAPAATPAPAPAAAPAADGPPGASNVVLSGWIDNFLTINSQLNKVQNDPTTSKDEKGVAIKFATEASVKVNWKVTDAMTARINLWIVPDQANQNLNPREAFLSYSLNDDITWTMGKYINHIGWLSAEPTGLWRPNATLIGYNSIYGNDVYGTNFAYADKDVPFTGSVHVVNGYFTAADGTLAGAYTPQVAPGRQNSDLGYGLDLIYNFPGSWAGSFLNLEGAYDVHSGLNQPTGVNAAGTPVTGLGGDAFEVGFNGTLKPPLANQPLQIGFEIQDFGLADGKNGPGDTNPSPKNGLNRVQGLIQVNYAFSGTPFPMSVTGSFEDVSVKPDASGAKTLNAMEIAAALNTNPLKGSPNLGVNLELAYVDEDAGYTTAFGGSPIGNPGLPATTSPTQKTSFEQLSFEAIATF